MTADAQKIAGGAAQLLRLFGEQAGRWNPLPHQIPPPPGWYGWLLMAGRGAGKALALDTPLPTPSGWTTMRDVQPGDLLMDETGRPVRVTVTSPVMTGRDCFRVRFSDGSELVADADHRWAVQTHAYRKAPHRRSGGGDPRRPQSQPVVEASVMTTAELRTNLRYGGRGDLNLSVPLAAPFQLPHADLPVDPYILGVWLGDGNTHRAAFTTMEPEIVAAFPDAGYELAPDKHQNSGRALTYAVRAADHSKGRSLHRQLRLLGVLGSKHVPAVYLRASLGQRLSLLQGLMDTDGYVDRKGCAEFAVTSGLLADGVEELVLSLGWKTTRSQKTTESGSAVYRVRFNPDDGVCTVARKRARITTRGAQGTRHASRMILSVEPAASVPVKCVAVDNESHLYLAGRAMIPTHNTDTCAKYVVDHVKGPPCLPGPHPHWIGIIAPTLGDAATSCFSGPSGISAHDPTARMVNSVGGTVVRWSNGSEAKLFGAHSVEDTQRLRSGGNRCLNWLEELAAWRYLDVAWAHMRFGLRVGPHPHWIGSTTPKLRPLIRRLDKNLVENVVVTRAAMYDNPHLPEDIRRALEDEYGGTELGRQELLGQLVEEVEGALWSHRIIDAARVRPDDLPDLGRISVGVDPSGGAGEQGIVVVGRSRIVLPNTVMPPDPNISVPVSPRPQLQGYVLADRTVHKNPYGWGRAAVQAAADYEADEIFVETNYGGDMAVQTIRSAAENLGIPIPIRKVTATRGKAVRAQPVSAITHQGRWHHAGTFEELEDQLCVWTDDAGYSPDRLDAMVWNAHGLRLASLSPAGKGAMGGDTARRSITQGR